MRRQLRDFQQRSMNTLRKKASRGTRRILLVSPTGSGKTVMACHLMEQAVAKGKTCLFLAHARELVHQCSDKLSDNSVPHGILMRGEQRTVAPVQVASKDTLHSRAIRREVMDLPPADLVILDESHRALAPTWVKLIDSYPDAHIIGLTATPSRPSDGRGLGEIYQDMVIAASYKELQEQGHLVRTRVIAPYTPDLKGVQVQAGDYNRKQLASKLDKPQLVGNIVKTWLERARERPTVAFAASIAHSQNICQEFVNAGIKAMHIDGNMDSRERDQFLRMLDTSEIQVICNCQVLCEGWDCPKVSCAILARSTRSIVMYRQMAGRIQRPHPGKDDALILDHSGAVFMHGFPDDDMEWTLDPSVNIDLRHRKEEEKKERIITCKGCGFAFRPVVDNCPECGMPRPKGRKVKKPPHVNGELREITRGMNPRETQQYKQKCWMNALGVAMGRDSTPGMAAHIYRSQFGTWPNDQLKHVPRGKDQWRMSARDFYNDYVKGSERRLVREKALLDSF